jgi:endoglucanase
MSIICYIAIAKKYKRMLNSINVEGKIMKYARSKFPTQWGRRGSRLYRIVKILRISEICVGIFFITITLSFAGFFSNVYGISTVSAPNNPMAIRSTINTRGVSSPVSVTVTKKPKKVGAAAVLGAATTSQTAMLPEAVSPKPAWTSMLLYTDPANGATQYVNANPLSVDVSYIARMGQMPVAQWFGDWDSNIENDVNIYVSAAASVNAVPVLVLYNIPLRDCGGYSTGGATSLSAYTQWMQQVAAGIGNRTVVVILEPDALGALECLSSADQQQERYNAIAQGVSILKVHPQTYVYIDAGTPVWQSTETMSARLKSANISNADGFSLNVSYFASTSLNQTYGDELSSLLGNKHYVIDTSRNGGNHTVSGAICNPSYASLGTSPTTNTGNARNDAFLWIKIPWESDGPCNGSPNQGVGYWSYAIGLAKNAGW